MATEYNRRCLIWRAATLGAVATRRAELSANATAVGVSEERDLSAADAVIRRTLPLAALRGASIWLHVPTIIWAAAGRLLDH